MQRTLVGMRWVSEPVRKTKVRARQPFSDDGGRVVLTQRVVTHMMSASPDPLAQHGVKFIDLFCGIGGASTGATEAGLEVVFAADRSAIALQSHAFNHPYCRHEEMSFPCGDDDIPWPTGSTEFHLHGSPPCTSLTTMQMKTDAAKTAEAVHLVSWFLRLAQRKSPRRWSMEQVAHPLVVRTLDGMRRTNRNVDYEVIDLAELQLPQHRRRLIAGPPWLVDRLRAFRSKQRYVSLGRAVPSMPPQAKYVRNSLVNYTAGALSGRRMPKRKSMRRVTKPSFTVVTSCPLRWYNEDMTVVRSVNIEEMLKVQGFPSWYAFPDAVKNAERLRGVGNALPPLVMALALGKRPLPVTAWEGERGRCDDASDSHGEEQETAHPSSSLRARPPQRAGVECAYCMPPVSVHKLLRRLEAVSEAAHYVRVTCTLGLHSLCYVVPLRGLERIVPLEKLMWAPPATHYAAYLVNLNGAIEHHPLVGSKAVVPVRGSNGALLYTTAGKYHNALDAEVETERLPKRGDKKTAVVTETTLDESPPVADDSPDTEYDSDGQPLPRNQGRTKKPPTKRQKRAAKPRTPQPENLAYRADIVAEQEQDLIDTYTVNHLGGELCTVLAQMLRNLHDNHEFTESGSVHLYTTPLWLRALRRQARDAGNKPIAAVASGLLMAEVRRSAKP